jgi:HD-GYP domain-containing protein (c-di-GMP phosphodiesterase class II)
MDEFERYAAGQASRVEWVAEALAEKLGLSDSDRRLLGDACLIHDIGEVAMDRAYISSRGRLSEYERLDLERHPVIGEQEAAKLGLSRSVQLIIRWHHEWWNGAGYPDRLGSDEIPLAARILRLADTYCALTAERPWREAMDDDAARRELESWAGIELDPAIVLVFRDIQVPTAAAPEPVMAESIFSSYN